MNFKKILFLLPFTLLLTACNGGGSHNRNWCYITFYDNNNVGWRLSVDKGTTISPDAYNNLKYTYSGDEKISRFGNDVYDFVNSKILSFKNWKGSDGTIYNENGNLFTTTFSEDIDMNPQYEESADAIVHTIWLKDLVGEELKLLVSPYYKMFKKGEIITEELFNSTPFYKKDSEIHYSRDNYASNHLTSYTVNEIIEEQETSKIKFRWVLQGLYCDGNNIIGSVANTPLTYIADYSKKTNYDIICRDIIYDYDIPIVDSHNTKIGEIKKETTISNVDYNAIKEIKSDYEEYGILEGFDFKNIHTFSGWFRSYNKTYLGDYESSSNPYEFTFEKQKLNLSNEDKNEVIYLNACYTPNINKYKFYSYVDEQGETIETDYIMKGDVELLGNVQLPNKRDLQANTEIKEVKGIIEEGFAYSNISKINLNNSFEPLGDNEVLGPTLTYIGSDAFRCCYYLREIILPLSLKYFGDNIFSECPNIKKFEIQDGLIPMIDEPIKANKVVLVLNDNLYTATSGDYHSPVNLTLCRSISKNTNIDGRTETIGSYSFSGEGEIIDLTLPNNVKNIESNAFNGCYSLKHLDLSNLTTVIPYYKEDGSSKFILAGTPIANKENDTYIKVKENLKQDYYNAGWYFNIIS